MTKNPLRQTLKEKKAAIGMFHYTGSPAFIEILGYSGFDFVIIDTEHASIDVRLAEHLFRAADASGITPLFRVYENSPSLINKALNFGAKGIVVPHVNKAEQAMMAVECTKYPPIGDRAACPGIRAADYSIEGWNEYCSRANEENLVILLLEAKEGLKNIDSIMSVPGVDVVFVGPWDLSQSLGVPGKAFDAPSVLSALQDVAAAAHQKGIYVMTVPLPTWTKERVKLLRDKGVDMFCFPDDLLIFADAARKVVKVKELAKTLNLR